MKHTIRKTFFCFFLLSLLSSVVLGQVEIPKPNSVKKGQMYLYWGWNNGWYTNSNIRFSGTDYDFTLKNVAASDRQSLFSINKYFNPVYATIPQYNVRLGYFFKNNWDLSIGTDHMKYVVNQGQTVKINGSKMNSLTDYDGEYENEDINIAQDFLQFEHTDGLNYPNVELRRHDELFSFNKISINSFLGLVTGILLPKTNTTLLNKERYDDFHLSGYGLAIVGGIKLIFFDLFFLQTEFKEGFINMPKIRTTKEAVDLASQHFFFTQANILFGGQFSLTKKQKEIECVFYF